MKRFGLAVGCILLLWTLIGSIVFVAGEITALRQTVSELRVEVKKLKDDIESRRGIIPLVFSESFRRH